MNLFYIIFRVPICFTQSQSKLDGTSGDVLGPSSGVVAAVEQGDVCLVAHLREQVISSNSPCSFLGDPRGTSSHSLRKPEDQAFWLVAPESGGWSKVILGSRLRQERRGRLWNPGVQKESPDSMAPAPKGIKDLPTIWEQRRALPALGTEQPVQTILSSYVSHLRIHLPRGASWHTRMGKALVGSRVEPLRSWRRRLNRFHIIFGGWRLNP